MSKTPECSIQEAKRNYHRTWRKENPTKVRNAQIRYWLRKAEALLLEENNSNELHQIGDSKK